MGFDVQWNKDSAENFFEPPSWYRENGRIKTRESRAIKFWKYFTISMNPSEWWTRVRDLVWISMPENSLTPRSLALVQRDSLKAYFEMTFFAAVSSSGALARHGLSTVIRLYLLFFSSIWLFCGSLITTAAQARKYRQHDKY